MRDETRLAVRRTGHWSIGWFLFLAAALALGMFLRTALAQPADDTAVLVQADVSEIETLVSSGVDPIAPGHEIDWAKERVTSLREFAGAGQWGPFVSTILMILLGLFATGFARFKMIRDWVRPYMAELALLLPMTLACAVEYAAIVNGAPVGEWLQATWVGFKVGGGSVAAHQIIVKMLWKKWGPKLWALINRLRGKAS